MMNGMWIPTQMLDDLKTRRLRGTELALWVFLKSLEEADGEGVEIGLEELAERFGMGKAHLSLKLRTMERLGYVRKVKQGRGGQIRRIIPVCPGRFPGVDSGGDREAVRAV